MVQEAVGVHNWHHDQRAFDGSQTGRPQQAANDLHPDHLVPMDTRANKDRWPIKATVDDMDGHRDRRMIRQDADRQVHCLSCTCRDDGIGNLEIRTFEHLTLTLGLGHTRFGVLLNIFDDLASDIETRRIFHTFQAR